jgi:hypothetical protein
MTAYRPPIQNVPIFDSANFSTDLDSPLTLGEGYNYFLSFPYAQGTQNFIDTITNGIGIFSNNLQTSFLSGIVGNGTFFIDGDTDGGDIVITTKSVGDKTIIQREEGGSPIICATFENDGITARLYGTSDYTYSVYSPEGVLNGSLMYDDGTYSRYLDNSTSTAGQSLLSGGSGVVPSWGTPALASTATAIAGGSANVIPYQTGAGATSFTGVGVAGQVLMSNGGTAAPSWNYNLGIISEVNTIDNATTQNYIFDSTNFYKINYITGSAVKNIVLPVGISPPPQGTFLIIQSKNNGGVNVYSQLLTTIPPATNAIIATNLINTLANPGTTNLATSGGQYVYFTATGWIRL